MANYSMDVRPVVNVSTVTYVNITLTIIQIMDLDEQNQVMITNAQITLVRKFCRSRIQGLYQKNFRNFLFSEMV